MCRLVLSMSIVRLELSGRLEASWSDKSTTCSGRGSARLWGAAKRLSRWPRTLGLGRTVGSTQRLPRPWVKTWPRLHLAWVTALHLAWVAALPLAWVAALHLLWWPLCMRRAVWGALTGMATTRWHLLWWAAVATRLYPAM